MRKIVIRQICLFVGCALLVFLGSAIIVENFISLNLTSSANLFYLLIPGAIANIVMNNNYSEDLSSYYNKTSEEDKKKLLNFIKKVQKINLAIIIIPFLIFIISIKYTQSETLSSILNSENVKINELVENNEIYKRNITLEMALNKANKVMSSNVNGVQISSQYQIDEESSFVQLYKNELVWIMPLDYKSFFSWLKQDNTPGYIIVSAVNPFQEPVLVNDKKITYTKNSFFGHNVNIISYFKSFFGITESHFEIDENGNPYYITLNLKPDGFYNGYITESVNIMNAETGESTGFIKLETFLSNDKYSWVDILSSESYIEDLINYKSLQNGNINYFAGENVFVPSQYKNSELWIIKTKKGLKWFTGMTSATKKDDSLVYAYYVDTRNGKSLEIVETPGVMTENGAAIAVEGKLGSDSIKWSPVLPNLVEQDGELYWDMIVTSDSNGVFQKYARVNAKNQSLVTISDYPITNSVKISSENDKDEMITISKKKYDLILLKIKELNELINN